MGRSAKFLSPEELLGIDSPFTLDLWKLGTLLLELALSPSDWESVLKEAKKTFDSDIHEPLLEKTLLANPALRSVFEQFLSGKVESEQTRNLILACKSIDPAKRTSARALLAHIDPSSIQKWAPYPVLLSDLDVKRSKELPLHALYQIWSDSGNHIRLEIKSQADTPPILLLPRFFACEVDQVDVTMSKDTDQDVITSDFIRSPLRSTIQRLIDSNANDSGQIPFRSVSDMSLGVLEIEEELLTTFLSTWRFAMTEIPFDSVFETIPYTFIEKTWRKAVAKWNAQANETSIVSQVKKYSCANRLLDLYPLSKDDLRIECSEFVPPVCHIFINLY